MSFEVETSFLEEADIDFEEKEVPQFARYSPNLERVKEVAEERDYESLIVIGNGGSITSFRGYFYAFLPEVSKDVRIVSTMDPDYLNRLSREMDPEETLVVPISKSGETIGVIESLFYFMERGYPVLAVTSDNDGALRSIVDRNDLEWVEHPEVGGRFSGATETALVPAALAGMDVDEIRSGAEKMYDKLRPGEQNAALDLALKLYQADQDGYSEILSPFYSTRMFGFFPLFVQLMHETVCKDGKGQTVYGDLGPEYQHHTNQRLFGGEEDVVPVFFRTETHEHEQIRVPEGLEGIKIRGRDIEDLGGQTYGEALKSEYAGVKNALDESGRPNATLTLKEMSYESAGEFIAFLQYLAVYSAWLRDVDPFTQPNVEKSKELGFEERFKNP
jgi:glucose-6-phosphate isomerase